MNWLCIGYNHNNKIIASSPGCDRQVLIKIMSALLFIACMGWLVSFLGQLPLGSMSLTATQIHVQEGSRSAWLYAIGVTIVEMIYLRLSLKGIDWVYVHKTFFTILGWLTVVFFLVLGIFSFRSARNQQADKKGLLINNKLNRFVLGLSLSAMNPAQIPFWILWSSYMLSWKILHSNSIEYDYFTVGAGIGTMSGLAVYMYGGNYLVTKLNVSNKTLNKIMGGIFIFAGAVQLYRMVV